MARFWKRRVRGEVDFGVCTDIGRVRTENQDTYGHVIGRNASGDAEHLFIVADGMGGYARGGEASRDAVSVIRKIFAEETAQPIESRLQAAFARANEIVYDAGVNGPARGRMGTTCTALAFSGERAVITHIGDTRAYRIRDGRIEKITVDHTLVEHLREEGVLTADEARNHPQRNALTRAIGIEETVQADLIDAGRVRPGDQFLLCTDGLSAVSEDEMSAVIRASSPQVAADKLVAMANERGGTDNITALVIRIK